MATPIRRTVGIFSPAGPAGSHVDTWREPSRAELDAIEAEWPLIAAELAVVDAETQIAAGDGGDLAVRRLADATRAVQTVAAEFESAGSGRFRRARRMLGGAA